MNPFRTLTGYVLSSLALASGLALGWAFYRAAPEPGFPQGAPLGGREHLPSEAGMYRAAGLSRGHVESMAALAPGAAHGGKERTRAVFDARRAYDGAPPRIPHETTDSLPGVNCLSCHAQGGWVERFKAFASITPHPEYTQCRQCHVPQAAAGLFTASRFERGPSPEARPAFDGAPPPMPHGLQLRENCSTCHVGPGAMSGIRTSHPERIQCMQCHVPQALEAASFIRRAAGGTP